MGKTVKQKPIGDDENGGKEWREGELIQTFHLNRIKEPLTPLMVEWLSVQTPELTNFEQMNFDHQLKKAFTSIEGWNEEELKVKFIGNILELGHLGDGDGMIGYYDKIISAVVDDIKLTVKADFMFAQGVLDSYRTPFFHFQEFKPYKNPTGDSMAQLLQAMMIAQVKNKNNQPIYGVEIIGKQWVFVIMEGKNYCLSRGFDAIDRTDLISIIAILRKFKTLLVERFLV
jgi:hypothetical protein